MHLQFQLTEPEFVQAQWSHAHASGAMRRATVVLGTAVVGILIGTPVLWQRGQLPTVHALYYLALPLALVVALRFYLPRIARQAWAGDVNQQGFMVVDCDPDGLVIRSAVAVTRVPYREIRDWMEDEQLVLLVRNRFAFHAIPKRAFATPGDVEVVRGWYQRAKERQN